MSSPDVVKILQRVSGVAEGQELASGLYVHGGNGDENLYLIDGIPLYDTNHALGLFSSFNADVVKNVDFYKSGFPARYGGRLSSVVDVRTADGNMNQFHGAYRIGLLDASVQFEGPIQKGKTSYNIGMRRSWQDLLSRPLTKAFSEPDEKLSIGYYFMDLNAKVTHRFSDRSKIDLSLYHGKDSWDVKDDLDESKGDWYHEGDSYNKELTKAQLNWGNFNAALNWNYLFSPKLFANFTAVYSHNRSKLYPWMMTGKSIHKPRKNGCGVIWSMAILLLSMMPDIARHSIIVRIHVIISVSVMTTRCISSVHRQ